MNVLMTSIHATLRHVAITCWAVTIVLATRASEATEKIAKVGSRRAQDVEDKKCDESLILEDKRGSTFVTFPVKPMHLVALQTAFHFCRIKWDRGSICVSEITCAELPVPGNVIISLVQTSYSVGTNVTFSCQSGYALQGAATSRCQSDGTWSETSVSCVGKYGSQFVNPCFLK